MFENSMIVYILFLQGETTHDIIGIYDSMEKAEKAFHDVCSKNGPKIFYSMYIREKQVL